MKLKVYVGWDPREDIAWEVCRHSILTRTDPTQVEVYPLVQSELRTQGLYNRPADTLAATEFSLTRFLTPHLAGHDGYAVFVDCDFLFLTDIRNALKEIDPTKAVSVVKHDYQPSETSKMDGCVQHPYPRKNWSSFMVFNCTHPAVRALTPKLVNSAEPSYLHRLQWLNDSEIGELDKGWNYLEGWYEPTYDNLKAIHFTLGGPWFEEKVDCDFADLWLREAEMLGIENVGLQAAQH
jgi:lipopolysaccharide biosynthesis glycosyltransferase